MIVPGAPKQTVPERPRQTVTALAYATAAPIHLGARTRALGISGVKVEVPGIFETRNLLDAEFKQESDRGCAILTVCLLEESLAGLFAAVLPGGKSAARQFMPPVGSPSV